MGHTPQRSRSPPRPMHQRPHGRQNRWHSYQSGHRFWTGRRQTGRHRPASQKPNHPCWHRHSHNRIIPLPALSLSPAALQRRRRPDLPLGRGHQPPRRRQAMSRNHRFLAAPSPETWWQLDGVSCWGCHRSLERHVARDQWAELHGDCEGQYDQPLGCGASTDTFGVVGGLCSECRSGWIEW